MLGGLLPTFVNLLSPTVADIPIKLAIFLAAATLIFIALVLTSPETRGRLERSHTHDDGPPPPKNGKGTINRTPHT